MLFHLLGGGNLFYKEASAAEYRSDLYIDSNLCIRIKLPTRHVICLFLLLFVFVRLIPNSFPSSLGKYWQRICLARVKWAGGVLIPGSPGVPWGSPGDPGSSVSRVPFQPRDAPVHIF